MRASDARARRTAHGRTEGAGGVAPGRRALATVDPALAAEHRNGGGPVGPGPLAEALQALAKARARGDRVLLNEALARVASASIRWRERL